MALTRSELITEINANFPDNTSRYITPALLRSFLTDLVNSSDIPLTDGALGTILVDSLDTTQAYIATKFVSNDGSIVFSVVNPSSNEQYSFQLSSALHTEITTNTTNITTLQGDVTTINSEISTINSEIAAITSYPNLTWIPISLNANWSVPSGFETPKYAIDAVRGEVHIKGTAAIQVSNLPGNTAIFAIAGGAQPNKNILRGKSTYDVTSGATYPAILTFSTNCVFSFSGSPTGTDDIYVDLFAIYELTD